VSRPVTDAATGALPRARHRHRRAGQWRRLGAIVLVVGLTCAVTACSGHDGDSNGEPAASAGPAAPRPTRGDFVAAANGLCDGFNQEMATIGDQLGDDASLDDLVGAYRDKALPALRDTVVHIRALGFPTEDDAALRALFDDVDAAIDRVQANPEKELQASNDPFESVNQRLESYGLERCAP